MNVKTAKGKMLFFTLLSVLILTGVTSLAVYTRQAVEAVNSCPSSLQSPITGLVNIDASTLTGDNIIDCTSYDIQIQSGGTLRIVPVIVDNDLDSDDYGVVIQANSVTIAEGGLIDLEGEGYGPGAQSAHVGSGKSSVIPCDSGFCGGSGAGHGGAGGRGDPDGSNEAGDPGTSYGQREGPVTLGSGGGESAQSVAGGAGGGALKLEVANAFTLNGTVTADGNVGSQDTDTGGGGGAGGSFWVEAGSFAGSGSVSADGGDGGEPIVSGGWGGGGGGGRVVMRCTTANTFSGTVTADEGIGNSNDGQVGTVVGASCYPYDPTSLAQYEYIDAGTQNLITDTGSTKYTSMQFRFNVSDVESSSTLTPQVEIREVGQAFTGNPTNTGSSVSYSGTPVEARVTVTGLTKTKEYKWQARSRDNNGVYSDWVEYEEDASEEIDFIVLGNPDTLVQISGDGQNDTVATQLSNPFIVELQDAVGHPIPDESISWQIIGGGGNLSNGVSTTDTSGRAQTTLTLGTIAGTDNNIVDAVKAGVTGSPQRFYASATHDVLHHYAISVPTVALISTDFDPDVVITAQDQYNNTVLTANTTVDLSVDPGTGNLTPVQATLTDGSVTISNMQYDTAENIKVYATDSTYEGYSDTVLVVSAYGTCFGFANDPGNSPLTLTAAGSPWTFTPTLANGGVVDCDQIDLTVEAGATVNLDSYDDGDTNWTDDFGTTLRAKSLTVEDTGVITASGYGYTSQRGPGYTRQGSSYGGYGWHGDGPYQTYYVPAPTYGDVLEPPDLGTGGYVTSGGGAMKIIVLETLMVNGSITSNGINATYENSGGATGGSIWVNTDVLGGDGLVQSQGGNAYGSAGGGAGGRVAVYYASMDGTNPFELDTDHINTYGGYGSRGYGGPGTIYVEQVGTDPEYGGDLYVDNNNHNVSNATVLTGDYSFSEIKLTRYGDVQFLGSTGSLTIGSGSQLVGDSTISDLTVYGTFIYTGGDTLYIDGVDLGFNGEISGITDAVVGNSSSAGMSFYPNYCIHDYDNPYVLADVTVKTGSSMTMTGYDNRDTNYTNDCGVGTQFDNLTIESGATVTGNGQGYIYQRGPGYTRHGSSHGGYGYAGVTPYDDVYQPILLGSGGYVSRGGSAFRLIALESLTNDGSITSDGANATYENSGGPSGGSVWIETAVLGGTGSIESDAGNSYGSSGGGAGGRIALYYSSLDGGSPFTLDPVHIHAFGSSGSYGYGGAGTVYIEQVGTDPEFGGNLYIDNNSHNAQYAGLISDDYSFTSINMTRYGDLKVLGSDSTLTVTSGDALVGDSTVPDLIIYGTFIYSDTDPLYIDGVDVGFNGEISGVDDVFVGDDNIGGMTLYPNYCAHDYQNPYVLGDVTVTTGSAITLSSYDNGDTNYTNDCGVGVQFDNLTVESGAFVTGSGLGYAAQKGPGYTRRGSSHGGYGWYGVGPYETWYDPAPTYGDVYEPIALGSGGYVSKGGGAMYLNILDTLTVEGSIISDGVAATYENSGGPSGGSVWIETSVLGGAGTIESDAGNAYGSAGGGAGGRIALYYSSLDGGNPFLLDIDHIHAFGSYGSWGYGGPGTIYIEQVGLDPSHGGALYIDNNNHNSVSATLITGDYSFNSIHMTRYGDLSVLGSSSTLTVTSGDALVGDSTVSALITYGTFIYTDTDPLYIDGIDVGFNGEISGVDDVVVGDVNIGGMTLYPNYCAHDYQNPYILGDVTVTTGSTVTLSSYDSGDTNYTNDCGVAVQFDNLTVETGAVVTGSGTGYASQRGPGYTRHGASHGGYGSGWSGTAPSPYGDVYEPVALGSGGYVSQGGGAMRIIVVDTLFIEGAIQSNAVNPTYENSGGPSGGSIWIETDVLGGSGTIESYGGNSYGSSGGGAGGRVALYYSSLDVGTPFSLDVSHILAYGGSGSNAHGGPGTIYLEHVGTDQPYEGTLYIDNLNRNSTSAGLISDDYSFSSIHMTRYGDLWVLGSGSTLTVTSGDALVGDSTAPMLSIDGLFSNQEVGILNVNGYNLNLLGDFSGVTGFNIGTQGVSSPGGVYLYAHTWARSGFYEFTDMEVGSDGLLSLASYDNGDTTYTNDYGITVELDNLVIEDGGIVTGTGLGYGAGRGPGKGTSVWGGGSGGGYGGYGGYAVGTTSNFAPGGSIYGDIDDLYEPFLLGSGGDDGSGSTSTGTGHGGSAIKLILSGTLVNNGTIRSNGAVSAPQHHGGGSGGSLWIDTPQISGTGIITANGGAGESTGNSGGGGGGRIAIYYDTNIDFTFDIAHVQARGSTGYNGEQHGGPGTVYIEDRADNQTYKGDLVIDNNSAANTARGMTFEPQDYSFDDVYIGPNSEFLMENDTDTNRGIFFDLTGSFTLGQGALLNGGSHGYPNNQGPGVGSSGVGQSGGGGAGHGGAGGIGQNDGINPDTPGGPIYDSSIIPMLLGSGGGPGGNGGAGGTGGGAFAIGGDPGTLTIDGTINMSAGNGTDDGTSSGGGGSGGSIYLKGCDIYVSASALLDVSGGDSPVSTFQGGGGGGGIISLAHTCTDTIDIEDLGSIDYSEGTGYQDGGVGVFTMYGAPSVTLHNQYRYQHQEQAIGVGETIDERAVRIRASVTDADAEDILIMEVELKPAGDGTPFDGTGIVDSDPVEWTLGDPIDMEVVYTDASLELGEGYKWRMRIRDESGATSPWYDFADNGDEDDFAIASEWAPETPVSLGQYKSDGNTSIPVGGTTEEMEVVLKATLGTAPLIGTLIPEFEVRVVGVDFQDVATDVGELESWLVGDIVGSVSVTGLSDLTNYHWQMRTCNGLSVCGEWVSFGGNAESEVDFGVYIPSEEEEENQEEVETEEEEEASEEEGEEEELPETGGEGEEGEEETVIEHIIHRFEWITVRWWMLLLIFLIGLMSILKWLGFSLADIPYFLTRMRLTTLYTLGWKSEGDPWGIVYDSVSKETLSRCVVRLYNAGGELEDTSVTDVSGVFNFEPRSGMYQIEVSRSGYYFPSSVIVGGQDGVRKNVYHGEEYEVEGDKEPVRMYVPMDREDGTGLMGVLAKVSSFLVGLLMVLSPFLLVLGMGLSYYYWTKTEDVFNIVMLFGYVLMLGLYVYCWLRDRGSWGFVLDEYGEVMEGVEVGLYDPVYGHLIDTRVTDKKGRFRFVVSGGEYVLKVVGTAYVLAESGYEAGYVVGHDEEGNQQITERVVVRRAGV